MHSKIKFFTETYKMAFKNMGKSLLQLFFYTPDECEICHVQGDIVCKACAQTMPKHNGVLCDKCGRQTKKAGLCMMCKKHNRPYTEGAIALYYQDIPKQLMQQFKFYNKYKYAAFFAREIYETINHRHWDIDIIAPVPMHPFKRLGKGYNPPAHIAKKLASLMSVTYEAKALKRTRYTKSMSLLKNIDRMAHAGQNFSVGRNVFEGKNILLVDDVSTTGATLHVCADILIKNGAKNVYVAAACGDEA